MDAFSTPAEHAFDHEVEVSAEAGPSSMGDAVAAVSIEEAFEVDDTIERILSGGYKTVSSIEERDSKRRAHGRLACNSRTSSYRLQCRCSRRYNGRYRHLGRRHTCLLIVPTAGEPGVSRSHVRPANISCCPDVLSCLHLPADFLVHYGHACLTP